MTTPSRKPSRATVITASVAIGVFGAGAGLGTVIATRANPLEGQAVRLAAGTYLLDDQAGAWTSQVSPGGDQPLPLSGSDAGSTVSGAAKDLKEQRVCLSATIDGRALGAVADGCLGLPVLATAGAAAALPQRPGNPKNTPPPPQETSAPKGGTGAKPSSSAKAPAKTSAPRDNGTSAPVQPAPDPGRQAPAQPPPVVNTRVAQPPAPTPTEKISGNISESENDNGSVIERPVEKKVEVVTPSKAPTGTGRTKSPGGPGPDRPQPTDGTQPRPRPTGDSGTGRPQPTGGTQPSQPGNTARPSQPAVTPQPSQPGNTPRSTGGLRPPQYTVTAQPSRPGDDGPRPTRPTGTLRPALPGGTAGPIMPSGGARVSTAPPATRPTDDPTSEVKPTVPPETGARPSGPEVGVQQVPPADPGPSQPDTQAPDGTVLRPPTPQLPGGQNAEDVLPVFKDPELMRRAYEALGLDRDMRYTDENGVWDLNIAPPGTPPCRDYTAEELQTFNASQNGQGQAQAQGGRMIPRDSCLWPAFIRWLYAEPAPGEVSNWTKFTGLPYRNLELVLTEPARQVPGETAPAQPGPDPQGQNPAQPGPGDEPAGNQGQDPAGDQGQDPAGNRGQDPAENQGRDPAQPDQGRLSPAQPGPGQDAPAQPGPGELPPARTAPAQPGPGQIEPDPYTGP
ncbi:hypothetical protein GCM10010517_00920 [Streptosporangium fragile]|uniref:Uncharacterized protein n=1 Tax=Streptosporangium fragile TaxID=46186 RepID=A0ABN3VNM8_9ACTN